MTKHIALLRGINVGGKRKVLMADLKILFSKLGYTNCITYIQSGNIIFDTDGQKNNSQLAETIQKAILDHYQLKVPVMVRKLNEWMQTIKENPFFNNSSISIDRLHLTLLDKNPEEELISKLRTMDLGSDEFVVIGQDVFICCEGKYSQSKLTNTLFEKKLDCQATTRNWKTVLKLSELCSE